MTPAELTTELARHLPQNLAGDIVKYFIQIRVDASTGVLERSAPGKFIETVVQILDHLERSSFQQQPKVDEYLRALDSRPSILPDDIRVVLTRLARAVYSLRNKRNIAHKGAIEPNIYDLRLIYASAQWILSELVAYLLTKDVIASNRIIEYIQAPISPLVEDFGEKRLVLPKCSREKELLLLLLHYYPNMTPFQQILIDLDRWAKSSIYDATTTAYKKKYIEGSRVQGYKLTQLGYQAANEIAKALSQ